MEKCGLGLRFFGLGVLGFQGSRPQSLNFEGFRV